ncbi:hypothetical protein BX600DRAFT_46792 [Xylariales sp. PMI_506]|nr:hypothetical protein BX600DRAFT_46792 [Xylariales sp. PMI_506]
MSAPSKVKAPRATGADTKPATTRFSAIPPASSRAKPLPYNSTVQLPRSMQASAPKRTDPSSPLYKSAQSRYIRFMIAMPILLVTSYALAVRLLPGSKQTEDNAKSTEPKAEI